MSGRDAKWAKIGIERGQGGGRVGTTAGAMEDNIITLVDEAGAKHDFTILEVVEIDDLHYAVLLPHKAPEEGVVVLRIGQDIHGEDVLFAIEDDDEFERVRQALEELDDEE